MRARELKSPDERADDEDGQKSGKKAPSPLAGNGIAERESE